MGVRRIREIEANIIMRIVKPLILAIVFTIVLPCPGSWASEECVIVLHGLGRTKWSMYMMERSLRDEGYRVWNESYPSTDEPIEVLAENHLSKGLAYCDEMNTSAVHFVTHSMGGIMLRQYFQIHSAPQNARAVLLAAPNKGSEIVDLLKEYWVFSASTGPAGKQLGTEETSLPNQLAPIDMHIGVIAGASTSDPWFSGFIQGEDDGKVSVESAKLHEMDDLLVVDSGHTFIMNNTFVIAQTILFLKHGIFHQ